MAVKIGILLIAVLAGSLDAEPIREAFDYHDSELFYHTSPSARIVGGTPAAEGSVPYMVALTGGLQVRTFVCGGSVLTQRTVLTAAHCIVAVWHWGQLVASARVTVGTDRWNSGGQAYALVRNVTHQDYVSQTVKNDIGILVTAENIIFSQLVIPVIPSYQFVGADVTARAAGWGRIRFEGPLSPMLLELFVSTVDSEQCVRDVAAKAEEIGFWNTPPVEPEIELCAANPQIEDHSMCNGDSGSALVRVDNGQQIGVVSWGLPCARGAPDVFVRLSAYRDWLLSHLV